MITLYHAPFTRSMRVRWFMEELGLAYELKRVGFNEGEHKSAEYLAVHPLGKLPAMTDGDVTMFESGAMLQYLQEKYGEGRLQPLPGTSESAEYLQWFHFGEATHMPYLSMVAQNSVLLPEDQRIPEAAAQSSEWAKGCLNTLEAHFETREFVAAGRFTAADIMVAYPLMLSKMFGMLTEEAYPHTAKYFGGMAARPAYQAATSD